MQTHNLIENLKSDHQDLEGYIDEIEDTKSVVEMQTLFKKLKDSTDLHFKAEEESIYVRCLEEKDETLSGLVKSGERDHAEIKQVIGSLGANVPQSPEWKEKVRELKSKIETYASREERELFPRLLKILNEKQMDKLRSEYISFDDGQGTRAA